MTQGEENALALYIFSCRNSLHALHKLLDAAFDGSECSGLDQRSVHGDDIDAIMEVMEFAMQRVSEFERGLEVLVEASGHRKARAS